jgi:hypothetical protein
VGDECLLADAVDVRHCEVEHQTGGQTEGDHRKEERHDLHDHLLLRVGLSGRIAALNLTLLHETSDGHDDDEHDEWQGMQDALIDGLAGALSQVEAECLHLVRH